MATAERPVSPEGEAARREFFLTISPHIRAAGSVSRIMWTVNATLVPAAAWAVYVFGPRALWMMALAIGSAVATEAALQALRRRPITVGDGSAFLTGLLTAFVLPVHLPWYVPVAGSVFAIAVAKQAFGGLGCNVWNPALAGRAFVLAAWAALVTVGSGWPTAFWHEKKAQQPQVDAVTAATPLTKIKETVREFNGNAERTKTGPATAAEAAAQFRTIQKDQGTPLWDLFLGKVGGCIGEVSALAILLGAIPLLALGYIRWQVPAFFIGTVALLTWMLPVAVQGQHVRFYVGGSGQPIFHILAGGLFLGAFYMATDMVTSPVTSKGLIIFAIGCGVLTSVIRLYGGYPEGVAYSILLMNTAVPIINRHTRHKVFGQRPKK